MRGSDIGEVEYVAELADRERQLQRAQGHLCSQNVGRALAASVRQAHDVNHPAGTPSTDLQPTEGADR